MTEIIAAIVGGIFALGAAVITVRWTRSRSTSDPVTPPPAATGSSSSPNVSGTTAGPERNASINAGQYINTNNGTVSQTNYRDGKQ